MEVVIEIHIHYVGRSYQREIRPRASIGCHEPPRHRGRGPDRRGVGASNARGARIGQDSAHDAREGSRSARDTRSTGNHARPCLVCPRQAELAGAEKGSPAGGRIGACRASGARLSRGQARVSGVCSSSARHTVGGRGGASHARVGASWAGCACGSQAGPCRGRVGAWRTGSTLGTG